MSLLLLSLAIMAKPSTADIIQRSWKETLVVGHRGAAAYKPENSLESFEEAIRSGAVATECDVHVSKDGELIVMHDSTLDRTTQLKGSIKDRTVAEMSAAGIPTLSDYLKVTKDRIVSVVEIKDGAEVVERVVASLRARDMISQSIVFSFNAEFIRQAEKLEPSLYTVWLNSKPADLDAHFKKRDDIRADGLGVQFKGANEELVKKAKGAGIPIFVWTVPPGPEVARLKALGVNFIITDHPKDVLKELGG
jgi:glycerophosphoryl diester phosphodiesterase